MIDTIRSKRKEVAELCVRFGVQKLEVFGSARKGQFDPRTSDLDFLVEFNPMPPAQYADSFFGLQQSLEKLFDAPVDLVEPRTVRNPYFRESLEEARRLIYEAA